MPNGQSDQGIEKMPKAPTRGLNFWEMAGRLATELPNKPSLDKIIALKSDSSLEGHTNELTHLHEAVMEILAKLKRENPNVNLGKLTPSKLIAVISGQEESLRPEERIVGREESLRPEERIVLKKGLSLDSEGRIILKKFHELVSGSGPIKDFLVNSWSAMVNEANEASKGWGQRLQESFNKNPIQTTALVAAGLSAVWLSYQAIKEIWSWGKGKKEGGAAIAEGAPLTVGGETGWKKRILIPLGIMIAGRLIGGEKLKELIKLMKNEEFKELADKAGKLPKEAGAIIAEEGERRGVKVVEAAKGVATKAEEELEELKQVVTGREAMFVATQTTLLAIYCLGEEKEVKNSIGGTFAALRDRTVEELKSILKAHKKEESIPISELKEVGKDAVTPENLFLALEIIVGLYDHLNEPKVPIKSTITVEELFVHAYRDPTHQFSEAFLGTVSHQLEEGDLHKIFSLESLSAMAKAIDNQKDRLLEAADHIFGADMAEWNDTEKKQYRVLQLAFYKSANLAEEPHNAVRNIPVAGQATDRVKQAAEHFFANVKRTTADFIPICVDKFGMDIQPGGKILEQGLKAEKMSFGHALQLALLATGTDWEAETPTNQEQYSLKNLALLNVVIRSLPRDAQEKYVGQLAYALANQSSVDIKLPDLTFLGHYLPTLAKIITKRADRAWNSGMNYAATFLANRPSEREDFIKQANESFMTSFLMEGGGGSLAIPSDVIGSIMAAIKARPEEIAGIQTGNDLLSLIFAKGGAFIFSTDKETGKGTGIIQVGWRHFVVKPAGATWETLKALWTKGGETNRFGTALKVYTVGASPFIVVGAVHGALFRQPNVSKLKSIFTGAAKGFAYPVTFPYTAPRIIGRRLRAVGKGTQMIGQGALGVYRGGRWVAETKENIFHWTTAIRRYRGEGLPSKNVALLLRDAELAEHYYNLRKDAAPLSVLEELKEWATKTTSAAKRAFAPDYINRMSYVYAQKAAERYNKFFFWGKSDVERLVVSGADKVDEIKNVVEKTRKANAFLRKLSSHPEFGSIRDISRLRGLIGEIGEGYLSKEAIKALQGRIRNAEAFQGLMADAKDYLRLSEGRAASLAEAVRATSPEKPAEMARKLKTGPQIGFDTLEELASAKQPEQIMEILKKSGLPTENIKAETLEEAVKRLASTEDIIEVKKEVEALAKVAGEGASLSPKAKWAFRLLGWAGKGLGGLGAAVGAYESGKAFYGAIRTEDAERRAALIGKGTVYGASAAMDTAAVLGAGGTGVSAFGSGVMVSAGGAGAFALLPITYMTDSIVDSKIEKTKTGKEWAESDPTSLIHDWISTGGISAGDAYRAAMPGMASLKEIEGEQQKTRENIVRGILEQQDGTVNEDRVNYIREICQFDPKENYHYAMEVLTESRRYAGMMAARREGLKKNASSLMTGKLNLMDPAFENPTRNEMRLMIKNSRDVFLDSVDRTHQGNFDRLSTGTLLDIAYQIRGVAEKNELPDGYYDEYAGMSVELENYLAIRRNVDVAKEYHKRQSKQVPLKTPEEILDLIESFDGSMDVKAIEESVGSFTDDAPCFAIYKLAHFFGYSGHQEIEEIKNFFREDRKDATGLYWDGENWYVNEAGWERDHKIGPNLDREAVEKIITILRDEPDDIFGHRQEAIVQYESVVNLSGQALHIAHILENALEGYEKEARGK